MTGPLNTRFAVAVHTLTLLAARPSDLVCSEDAAESVGTNPTHVRRVLAGLREAGLVASRSGPHGGWQLARDPQLITLGDIWRAVQGDEPLLVLHEGGDPGCPIGAHINECLEIVSGRTGRAVESELDRMTLADVYHDTLTAGARV